MNRLTCHDGGRNVRVMTQISEADAQLSATSTPALLRAAYSLTHQMHIARGRFATESDTRCVADDLEDLRGQRNLIDAEIIRRTNQGA